MSTKTRKVRASKSIAASELAPSSRFIEAYENAVQGYIDEYVTITIENVTFPGAALNTNEEGKYEVVIFNGGPLMMTNVTMHTYGRNGTTTKGGGAIAQFTADWAYTLNEIGAGESHRVSPSAGYDTFQHMYFKAPSNAVSESPLLEVVIDEFEADFAPLLNSNNGGGSGEWVSAVGLS